MQQTSNDYELLQSGTGNKNRLPVSALLVASISQCVAESPVKNEGFLSEKVLFPAIKYCTDPYYVLVFISSVNERLPFAPRFNSSITMSIGRSFISL
jgi:hypothetical protein